MYETEISKILANDVMFLFKVIQRQVDLDFDKYFSFNYNMCMYMYNILWEVLSLRQRCQSLNGLPASFVSLKSFDIVVIDVVVYIPLLCLL